MRNPSSSHVGLVGCLGPGGKIGTGLIALALYAMTAATHAQDYDYGLRGAIAGAIANPSDRAPGEDVIPRSGNTDPVFGDAGAADANGGYLVRRKTRRSNGLPPRAVHRDVHAPVYVATSPEQFNAPFRSELRGTFATSAHPPTSVSPDSPTLSAVQEKLLAAHRRELRDADPYEPLGLRLGSIYVSPSIEQDVGYDTNPGEVQGGKGSRALRTEGAVKLRSDWSSDELTGDLRGGYFYFPDVKGANRPDGEGKVDLRLDVTKDFDVLTEIRGSLTTQQPDSVNLPVATKSRPLVYGYGTSLAANYHPGYWHFTLRGNIDRTEYANATLVDGTTFDQSDRNLAQYELRARLGYDVSPAFRPFVEARADTRQYDLAFDFSGFARSSDGMAGLVGAGLELTRTLTGEIAVGYGQRSYEDARLKDLGGPLTEASLSWSVTPLTTITLKNSTQFVETTLAGSPGALERQIGLEISHALLRNLIITGSIAWTHDHYETNVERDNSFTTGAKAEWKLNRNLVIKASFLHTQEITNVVGRDYGENTYLIGARFQY
ncbi:MAG: outer membrane beta-barrel protein [Hyphomicrobiales bacterium]|nr:outer membrane beta-barrel protein [Hyphomicrobiales bacterium]